MLDCLDPGRTGRHGSPLLGAQQPESHRTRSPTWNSVMMRDSFLPAVSLLSGERLVLVAGQPHPLLAVQAQRHVDGEDLAAGGLTYLRAVPEGQLGGAVADDAADDG